MERREASAAPGCELGLERLAAAIRGGRYVVDLAAADGRDALRGDRAPDRSLVPMRSATLATRLLVARACGLGKRTSVWSTATRSSGHHGPTGSMWATQLGLCPRESVQGPSMPGSPRGDGRRPTADGAMSLRVVIIEAAVLHADYELLAHGRHGAGCPVEGRGRGAALDPADVGTVGSDAAGEARLCQVMAFSRTAEQFPDGHGHNADTTA